MTAEKKIFMFDQDFDDVALLNEIARKEVQSRAAKSEDDENDTSLDAPIEEEEEEIVPTFSEEDIAAARQQGFNDGKIEGSQEAQDSIENEISQALETIGQKLTEIFKIQDLVNEALSKDAVALSLAVGRKLFPKLNEEHGLGEITSMMESVLGQMIQEPKITIYGNDKYSEHLSERIEIFLSSRGFEGEVNILGDESIDSGDCRIEWSNGEAVRDMSALLDDMTDTIEQYTDVSESAIGDAVENNAKDAENGGVDDLPEGSEQT